ncbi:MAG: hypothetical protein BGP06_15135 [Rhizobiales bacterium 65-9]|nr:DNA-binding protein [Hyphomicrobiales bacterium]OJY38982.1 MAG: hypothetical protein BGP06_15135 [Rhizobiales bacterium 65-9]
MTIHRETPEPQPSRPGMTPKLRTPRRRAVLGAGAILIALGAGLAGGYAIAQRAEGALTPIPPVAVSSLAPSAGVSVKGKVAEIYGDKFVLQDETGRALIETGPEWRMTPLVSKDEMVSVQGRFENGSLHARLLTRADGKQEIVGGRPPRGPMAWARERIEPVGLDPAQAQAIIAKAGYTDVRIVGRGPRHYEIAAKDRDGRETELHLGFDGDIRERRVF